MNKILFLYLLLGSTALLGQLSGVVVDENDQPMPYVSIYVKGASVGTTTNAQGEYLLKLTSGNYQIVYQFVGYQSVERDIIYNGAPLRIDVTLLPQALLLDEVVVAADAEDPAYRVIRAAIAKRKFHLNQVQKYACDVYVKGNNKILDAPEKILGMEVGDMEGVLDSNRQGMVYLSESVSKLYYQAPDNYKEVVTSSKVSGDDRGYSYNSAKEMDFNIYENTSELNRAIVSPIAGNALNYYRYRLEGTFYDSENRLINKIAVIPKRDSDPVFYGTIYIVENQWNVHSLNLGLTEKASQLYFLDSLTFEQVFIPMKDPNVWRLFNNTISFKFGAFGFVMKGLFTAIYSNYDIDPVFENGFFNSITHKVEAESNKRDSSFWAEVRPVPLTTEEMVDYVQKDSLFEIRNSPEFKDSIDRENNKFSFGSILGGYSYQNSNKHTYWEVTSPIGSVAFNTVQGVTSQMDLNWRKYFDEEETRRLLWYSTINYGFSEKKLRASGSLVYRPDRLTSSQYNIFGGSKIQQFNGANPISTSYNTIYSLMNERNYAKFYAKDFVGVGWQTDVFPGLILNSSISYESRNALTNQSNWVINDSDSREYTSNNPLNPVSDAPAFEDHKALILDVKASIRIGQKYTLFPDRRYSDGFKGPLISVGYRSALGGLVEDVTFHKLDITLQETLTLGVIGELDYFINGGGFFGKKNMQFVDYQHFLGSQILLGTPSDYGKQFFLLPYYSHSTSDRFLQMHAQHHFNGWVLDKIPGINQLGLSLVAGAKYLHTGDRPDYGEFHLGLDKIGWKLFRIFRVDAVMSLTEGKTDWGMRLGIGF